MRIRLKGINSITKKLVAATESGRPVHLLEKDIWVVWAIDGLFLSEFGKHLVFKGGTSLSKAYDGDAFQAWGLSGLSRRLPRRPMDRAS